MPACFVIRKWEKWLLWKQEVYFGRGHFVILIERSQAFRFGAAVYFVGGHFYWGAFWQEPCSIRWAAP